MTQAIFTRYLGPTNHRGTRVKASCAGSTDTVTLAWDYALNDATNHKLAAFDLIRRMDWAGTWVGGSTVDGYAFVNIHGADSFDVPAEV